MDTELFPSVSTFLLQNGYSSFCEIHSYVLTHAQCYNIGKLTGLT